jgi:hypothetical protein
MHTVVHIVHTAVARGSLGALESKFRGGRGFGKGQFDGILNRTIDRLLRRRGSRRFGISISGKFVLILKGEFGNGHSNRAVAVHRAVAAVVRVHHCAVVVIVIVIVVLFVMVLSMIVSVIVVDSVAMIVVRIDDDGHGVFFSHVSTFRIS